MVFININDIINIKIGKKTLITNYNVSNSKLNINSKYQYKVYNTVQYKILNINNKH